jgi:membrane protein DedA with SNARE-associated domain
MDSVFAWLAHYGYAGLFLLLMFGIVGLPVPDETLLVFCGYLIWRGRLHYGFTFLAAFLGSGCGISLSYLIGRKFGRKAIHNYGRYIRLTPERLHKITRWFHRIGGWVLTVGYFIPGVRHFTAVVAGISHMKYCKFAAFAYPGAAIWVATFLILGYFVGEGWEHASAVVHRYLMIGGAACAALATILWLIYKKRHRRTQLPKQTY